MYFLNFYSDNIDFQRDKLQKTDGYMLKSLKIAVLRGVNLGCIYHGFMNKGFDIEIMHYGFLGR